MHMYGQLDILPLFPAVSNDCCTSTIFYRYFTFDYKVMG